MKTFSFLQTLSLILFAGWLLTSCAGKSDEATPQGNCRIQQYAATDKSQFATTTLLTTYTYDPSGNLTKSVATVDTHPVCGTVGTQLTTTTNTYTYDANGFLTTAKLQRQSTAAFPDGPRLDQYSSVTSYSYTGGRLSQRLENYSGTYVTPNGDSNTYEYDTDGTLIRIINTGLSDGRFQTISTYQNGQLVDYVNKVGTTESRPFTIQDGLITKMVFPGTEHDLLVTSAFDNQKRLIRTENYVDKQLTEYTVQTWTNAKSAQASLPVFKGFPAIEPDASQMGVIASSQNYAWNSVTKTMQQYSDCVTSVETNAQGYVLSAVTTRKGAINGSQGSVKTETYTYTGCQ